MHMSGPPAATAIGSRRAVGSAEMDTIVWFNPACPHCPTAQGILQERGVDASYIRSLD